METSVTDLVIAGSIVFVYVAIAQYRIRKLQELAEAQQKALVSALALGRLYLDRYIELLGHTAFSVASNQEENNEYLRSKH